MFEEMLAMAKWTDLQQAVARGIRTASGDALFIRADISDTKQVQRLITRIARVYGRLDVLYNNAGIGPPQDTKVHDLDEAVWDRVLSVNIRGMFLCSKYAIRLMLEILGPAANFRPGSPEAAINGRVGFLVRAIHILTFGGGTNEMQRDLIALFGLGMPVQPRF